MEGCELCARLFGVGYFVEGVHVFGLSHHSRCLCRCLCLLVWRFLSRRVLSLINGHRHRFLLVALDESRLGPLQEAAHSLHFATQRGGPVLDPLGLFGCLVSLPLCNRQSLAQLGLAELECLTP